jgi:hypothetical protein
MQGRGAPMTDRGLVLRSVVAVAAIVVGLAGCGAAMPGAVVGGGGPVAAPTSPAGNGGDLTPTGQAPQVGPGVTDDSVTVVFVVVALGAVEQSLGFATASPGDPEVQIAALEQWVNDNGGLSGRRMRAVVRYYEAAADSPSTVEQMCTAVTQDDRAFAVVLTGQFQDNARPCYAQRSTLMLDGTLVSNDDVLFEELAPYLWSASYPGYDEFVRGMMATLEVEGFLEDADRVGVVAADTAVNRRIVGGEVSPWLTERGAQPAVAWIDTTDLGTLNTGLRDTVTNYRSQGVEHVLFLGGARIAPFFMTTAAALEFDARYAISSFDNPGFMVNNPSTIPRDGLPGSIGIGFNPSQDVPDITYPFPATEAERTCLDIYTAAGETFETRENARSAFVYCDATRLLYLGARDLGPNLNAAAWGAAVQQLGEEFQPATGFGGRMDSGRHAVSNRYRVMAYDADCACFAYRGNDVVYPADSR